MLEIFFSVLHKQDFLTGGQLYWAFPSSKVSLLPPFSPSHVYFYLLLLIFIEGDGAVRAGEAGREGFTG